MTISTELKEKILAHNKIEKLIGYCFPTPCAEESDQLTFVEKEMVYEVLEKGVQTYYWSNCKERLMDLDEAWDNYVEDFIDSYPTLPHNPVSDWTQENIDAHVLEEYYKTSLDVRKD